VGEPEAGDLGGGGERQQHGQPRPYRPVPDARLQQDDGDAGQEASGRHHDEPPEPRRQAPQGHPPFASSPPGRVRPRRAFRPSVIRSPTSWTPPRRRPSSGERPSSWPGRPGSSAAPAAGTRASSPSTMGRTASDRPRRRPRRRRRHRPGRGRRQRTGREGRWTGRRARWTAARPAAPATRQAGTHPLPGQAGFHRPCAPGRAAREETLPSPAFSVCDRVVAGWASRER
jgi:hypothetical protein